MAWPRRAHKRGGRKRFFRRRRSSFRPTTEEGGRLERCYFNVGVDQPVSNLPATPVYDAIMLASPASLSGALGAAGAQAVAVGRLLQVPLRDLSVAALVFDAECVLSPGLFDGGPPAGLVDWNNLALQIGLAIYTQRLDEAGAPTGLPVYDQTQWPVNQTDGWSDAVEDTDYATRTHFHRAGTLAPDVTGYYSSDPLAAYLRPGWSRFRTSVRVQIKRRISDDYGLFLGFWNKTPPTSIIPTGGSAFWRVTGSMWYRMKF